MTLHTVEGDPLLTQADALLMPANARGQHEMDPLTLRAAQAYPAAFAAITRRARAGRIPVGTLWTWHESRPRLVFALVRQTAVGATRLRYVQSIAMTLARDHRLLGINSLAIPPLGRDHEWVEIQRILATWLDRAALPVTVYAAVIQGHPADETPPG